MSFAEELTCIADKLRAIANLGGSFAPAPYVDVSDHPGDPQ